MKVWKAFAASRRVRIVCFALAAALLVGSVIGLVLSAAIPGEAPTAGYEHRGQFDYTVYIKPGVLYGDAVLTEQAQEDTAPMVFFREIIENVQIAFSYSFDSVQPLSGVTNQVVVSIIAENPGIWRKEIVQLEETYTGQKFRVDFPLALTELESAVAEIESEIGITSTQKTFIVRARVTTTADTAMNTTFEHQFSHELAGVLTARRLDLKGDLDGSREGYTEGIRYEARGRFDYEVSLKPNKLYETDVLRSEVPPAQPSPPAQPLGPGLRYFPRMIDNIQARFSYQLVCEIPISEQSQEVDISVTVENPGTWSRTLVLVPRTAKEGSFALPFPLDLQYLTRIIDAIGQETGARGTSHNIVLQANVHTVAETEAGALNEVYTQTLRGTLEANSLTFDKELSRSQSGTIGGATMDAASAGGRPKTPWIIGLVLALLALGYFAWSQTRLGLAPVSAGQAEAARARKKYKQLLVDVDALPEAGPGDTVVPLSSIDDLVRIADDLARPVLHHTGDGRHTFCLIDSGVRYHYVIEP